MPDTIEEIGIEMYCWSAEHVIQTPTLIISLDALVALLHNEVAAVKADDVPRLLGAIHSYAVKAGTSEDEALRVWKCAVELVEETAGEDDESEAEDEH